MKKNIKKKQKIAIPAAVNGLEVFKNFGNKAAGVANAAIDGIDFIADRFAPSNATTGKEAAVQSVQDIGKGMATGAKIGKTFGPMGAAVGAVAGAAVGLVGKNGKEASMSSFTDYNQGTLGTGLIGAFKNKELRRERARIKSNALQNTEAVIGTDTLQNEWLEEHAGMETDTFEQGGSVPSSLAYVDDGELISTPQGDITKIPENGNPTDSNLVSLPIGSRVLSDTLKVPGTNKTFAELGDKMITKKKSKNNDVYAQNSNKLNELNNKAIHDKLFYMQEELKAKKGIKPKQKSIDTFVIGGDNNPYGFIEDLGVGYGNRMVNDIYNPYRTWGASVQGPAGNYQWYHVPLTGNIEQPLNMSAVSKPRAVSRPNSSSSTSSSVAVNSNQPNNIVLKHKEFEEKEGKLENKPAGITIPTTAYPTILTNSDDTVEKPEKNRFNWEGFGSSLASLSPIISNLFTGDAEKVRAVYNPYERAIVNTMGNRKYNIAPLLRDIEANRNAANYAASHSRTNTGQDMAFRLQNTLQTNREIARARAAESNQNNAYRAEYANAMNDLGKQWVNATNLADVANAQNRAAVRNIRRKGLSQLSAYAQNKELMRNQQNRDNAMMKLYDPFLQAGFSKADLINFKKFLNKGGNK